MSKIPTTHVKGVPSFEYQVTHAVNGNLEYGLNFKSTVPISVQTPLVANTEFTVTHSLGFVPTGFHVLSKDQTCDVVSSRISQWTTSQLFLKCTAASANLVLVVL